MKVGDATCRTRGRSDTVVPLRNLRSECESEAFLMAVYMAMYSHIHMGINCIQLYHRLCCPLISFGLDGMVTMTVIWYLSLQAFHNIIQFSRLNTAI